MAPTVLIPLRTPGEGKTRLAGVLTVDECAELAAAMLADVVAAVSSDAARVVVAAGGSAAATLAADLGAEAVLDPDGAMGLDAALAAAVQRLDPTEQLLIVPADVPRLRPEDVRAVLDQDAEVVVAPTGDGGTGALLRRPATAISTRYGPDSARRHLALATRAGRRSAWVVRAGFDDIDTIDDLDPGPGPPLGRHTAAVVARFASVP